MFENIRLAFQGIWGHKMRSVLTMLGIIIGIAAIITIVSTIKGTNEISFSFIFRHFKRVYMCYIVYKKISPFIREGILYIRYMYSV